jgi:amino acid transporter
MSERFQRKLRLFPLVALIFASLSGGPFGIEDMLPSTGPGMTLLLLVLAAFLWALPMSLACAELGSMYPVEGGYYRWTRRALGDLWGFLAGYWVWLSSVIDQAIYPVLMVSFLERFVFPGLRSHLIHIPLGGLPLEVEWVSWLLCMAVIVPCAIVNVRGIQPVGITSIVLDALILGPYVIFVALAFGQWQYNPLAPFVPTGETIFGALGYGLLLAMWNFSGYELPSTASEEVENASVNLPKALFLALPLVIASYTLPIAAALMVRDDWRSWSEGTFVDIARQIGGVFAGGGEILGGLITLSAVAGTISLFNGLLVPYTRIQLAMAEDGFMPRPLARLHPRFSTPHVSILFNCALYSILVMLPFEELLTIDVLLLLPAYPLVYISLWVLRRREPDRPRPFRLRGGVWGLVLVVIPPCFLALFAIVSSVADLISNREYRLISIGIAFVVSGPAAYLVAAAWHRLRGTRLQPVIGQGPAGGPPGHAG